MTERAQAREYFLESLDPETIRRPQAVLRLRTAWHAGTFEPGAISKMDEADAWEAEPEEVFPEEGPIEVTRRKLERVPDRAISEGFKKFVVLYFCIVFLRALYKAMSGDDS